MALFQSHYRKMNLNSWGFAVHAHDVENSYFYFSFLEIFNIFDWILAMEPQAMEPHTTDNQQNVGKRNWMN